MSAFCGCFKSTAHVDNNNPSARRPQSQRGALRNSIRKEGNEMDLLELNKRGMDGAVGEEWIEDDDNDEIVRVSHQTDMLDPRGRYNEESKVSFDV